MDDVNKLDRLQDKAGKYITFLSSVLVVLILGFFKLLPSNTIDYKRYYLTALLGIVLIGLFASFLVYNKHPFVIQTGEVTIKKMITFRVKLLNISFFFVMLTMTLLVGFFIFTLLSF